MHLYLSAETKNRMFFVVFYFFLFRPNVRPIVHSSIGCGGCKLCKYLCNTRHQQHYSALSTTTFYPSKTLQPFAPHTYLLCMKLHARRWPPHAHISTISHPFSACNSSDFTSLSPFTRKIQNSLYLPYTPTSYVLRPTWYYMAIAYILPYMIECIHADVHTTFAVE